MIYATPVNLEIIIFFPQVFIKAGNLVFYKQSAKDDSFDFEDWPSCFRI